MIQITGPFSLQFSVFKFYSEKKTQNLFQNIHLSLINYLQRYFSISNFQTWYTGASTGIIYGEIIECFKN